MESAASSWDEIVSFKFHPQVLDEIVPEVSESNSESDLGVELWEPEQRGARGPYIPPFLGEKRGEIQGPSGVELWEPEQRGPRGPNIPPFSGEKRGEVQGPPVPYWAPEMTQISHKQRYEILEPYNLPIETGLEVNERGKLEFRGPWGEGQPREGEEMGPDPDPLEQFLPDMGVGTGSYRLRRGRWNHGGTEGTKWWREG